MSRGYKCPFNPLSGKLTSVVQALSRLTPREHYDRVYRFKRACQASVLHAPLPKEQWMKPEEVRHHPHSLF